MTVKPLISKARIYWPDECLLQTTKKGRPLGRPFK
jgi:hypothetical protein